MTLVARDDALVREREVDVVGARAEQERHARPPGGAAATAPATIHSTQPNAIPIDEPHRRRDGHQDAGGPHRAGAPLGRGGDRLARRAPRPGPPHHRADERAAAPRRRDGRRRDLRAAVHSGRDRGAGQARLGLRSRRSARLGGRGATRGAVLMSPRRIRVRSYGRLATARRRDIQEHLADDGLLRDAVELRLGVEDEPVREHRARRAP